jgi:hypothetical protein
MASPESSKSALALALFAAVSFGLWQGSFWAGCFCLGVLAAVYECAEILLGKYAVRRTDPPGT